MSKIGKGVSLLVQGNRIIIDKKYVHKLKEENVFLCNLRRVLPFTIDKDLFENDVKMALPVNEYDYLKSFYGLYIPTDGTAAGSPPVPVYAIRYLPAINALSPEMYERLLDEKPTVWEKELFASLYTRESDGNGSCFRLKEDITEPHDNYLLSSRKAWDLYITIDDRCRLASILEKVPELPRKEIYFANMFVNTAHLFFFEHPNDHVPGVMMIETMRQFIVACAHLFGKIPMQGTQLILSSLECQFMSYINVNYPILLKGIASDYKFAREGYWQQVTLRTEVFQNGRCMALFNLKGTCISSGLFERIRRNQIAEMKRSRFFPLPSEKCTLELSANGDTSRITADLINLSFEGMSIKMNSGDFLPDHDIYSVSLSLSRGGNINGKYKKIWHSHQDNGHVVIGLRNTDMGERDLEMLHSLITRDCMALDERQLS